MSGKQVSILTIIVLTVLTVLTVLIVLTVFLQSNAACGLRADPPLQGSRLLAESRSIYSMVRVRSIAGIRYLYLGNLIQSAMDAKNPRRMIYNYTKLIGTAMTAHPFVREGRGTRILIIGLGGCAICRHVAVYYPRAQTEAVEIDPVVVKYSRRFFSISPSLRIHVVDGRLFLKQRKKKYDIILLDAFNENYVPAPLITVEFFKLVRRRLRPRGIVLANFWSESKITASETRTTLHSLGPFYEFRYPGRERENRILLFRPDGLSPRKKFRNTMRRRLQRLKIREFDGPGILRQMRYRSRSESGIILRDANVQAYIKSRGMR